MKDLKKLLTVAKESALAAGAVIMDVYSQDDLFVEIKADNSPLTMADKKGNDTIMSFLQSTNIPVLSEEGRNIPFEERNTWDYFWMVDPLDGTKEFVKRNGEFTVNIALIHAGKPIIGVVFAPAINKLYYGSHEEGAWLTENNGSPKKLQIQKVNLKSPNLRVVASRSHLSSETEAFVRSLENPSFVSMGSSLKLMVLAEGNADVYPRFAPTMEWDTAAAHAVVNAAGGEVWQYPNFDTPLTYNKENLLNPWFLVL